MHFISSHQFIPDAFHSVHNTFSQDITLFNIFLGIGLPTHQMGPSPAKRNNTKAPPTHVFASLRVPAQVTRISIPGLV